MADNKSTERYYWQPLSLSHLLSTYKLTAPKVIVPLIGWLLLICGCLLINSLLIPTELLNISGDKMQITRFFIIYPTLLMGILLLFWMGFEWGFIPIFISSFVMAFFSGMSVGWSVIFGFSFIFGLALFGVAYQSLYIPYDLRDFKSIAFFILVAFVASIASSMGAFVWSLSHGLSAGATAIIWQSWWTGVFFQSIIITGPLLWLFTPFVEKVKRKYFNIRQTNEISLKWIYGTVISITAALIVFIISGELLGRFRVAEVLRRLPYVASGDVFGALGSFEIIFWLSIGIIIVTGYTAIYLIGRWNGQLKDKVAERTEQLQKSKQELHHALEEKKTLLKEVHHRVKNNLAQVNALLQLQIMTVDDEKYTRMMQDSCTRIQTMSLIHQALYDTEDFSSISLEIYLRKLCTTIHRSFRSRDADINMNLDLIDYKLNTKQAIPVGLIVTEILINAHKYAFKGKKQGNIHVALHKEGAGLLLSIRDDGVGLPKKSVRKKMTLGMELIHKLSTQINGDLTIQSDTTGTGFSLVFEPAQ